MRELCLYDFDIERLKRTSTVVELGSNVLLCSTGGILDSFVASSINSMVSSFVDTNISTYLDDRQTSITNA
jgi:hypothetical protein